MYNNSEAFSILISKINAYKKSGYVLIFYIKKRGNPENETKEALIFRERVIFTFCLKVVTRMKRIHVVANAH